MNEGLKWIYRAVLIKNRQVQIRKVEGNAFIVEQEFMPLEVYLSDTGARLYQSPRDSHKWLIDRVIDLMTKQLQEEMDIGASTLFGKVENGRNL